MNTYLYWDWLAPKETALGIVITLICIVFEVLTL